MEKSFKSNEIPSNKLIAAVGGITFLSIAVYQSVAGYGLLSSIGSGLVCGVGVATLVLMPTIMERNKFKNDYYGIRPSEIKEYEIVREKVSDEKTNSKVDDISFLKEERELLTKDEDNYLKKEWVKEKSINDERFK